MEKRDAVAIVHKDQALLRSGLKSLEVDVLAYRSLDELAESVLDTLSDEAAQASRARVKYLIAEVIHGEEPDSRRVATRSLKGAFPRAGQFIVTDSPERAIANMRGLGGITAANRLPANLVGLVANNGADLGIDLGGELFENTFLTALGAENFKEARAAVPGVWQKYLLK